MNIPHILSTNAISQKWLASKLWPNDKHGPQRLCKKIANKNGQRLTDKDIAGIEAALKELFAS